MERPASAAVIVPEGEAVPPTDVLPEDEVRRLPPMLFGRIRWAKGLRSPIGEVSSGFAIRVEEHTVSQFQIGTGGIETKLGTGIWKTITESAPCRSLPDEGDRHVVGFDVPDVHLTAFPDGMYRVTPTLTGKWSKSLVQVRLGFRRIEPRFESVRLTPDHQIRYVDFEVVQEPWRLGPFG
jgi:hypothetical protein